MKITKAFTIEEVQAILRSAAGAPSEAEVSVWDDVTVEWETEAPKVQQPAVMPRLQN